VPAETDFPGMIDGLRDMADRKRLILIKHSEPSMYSLPRGGRQRSPYLTVDEALSLMVPYEAFMCYSVIPGVVQRR
jgi:hypothetical protein